MIAKKYRKNPIVIEAIQLDNTPEAICSVLDFVFKTSFASDQTDATSVINNAISDGGIVIPTSEGKLFASFGDYVIKGIDGGFYPCKPDVFEESYTHFSR